MFDWAAPKQFPITKKRLGVGAHPHRGFQTVTIAFQGEVQHHDSTGNQGVITEGGVQWMSAASGIVHEEYHSEAFAARGGIFEMAQLWVNLPADHKMSAPCYQGIDSSQIPVVEMTPGSARDGNVRVIAGNFRGTAGVATTYTPIDLWDVRDLPKDKQVDFEVPEGHQTSLFIRKGSIVYGDKSLSAPQMVLLSKTGSSFSFTPTADDTCVLILSGEPIDEPIAARGPFVMNTELELRQAMQDYQAGRF